MHWLQLIIGNCLQQNGFDTVSNLPEELAQHCISGYKSGSYDVPANYATLLQECMLNPVGMNVMALGKLDPVARVSALLFSWFSFEHQAFTQLGTEGFNEVLVSPELARTSLWMYGLLVAALTPKALDYEDSPVSWEGLAR